MGGGGCPGPASPAPVPQVFLGVHDAGDRRSASNRSVERIILHPDFQADSYDNDIALLRLRQGAGLGRLVQPVCLPRLQPQVSAGGRGRRGHAPSPPRSPPQDAWPVPRPRSLGVVAGWGISSLNASSSSGPSSLTSDPGPTSDLLQYVKLPVVSQEECQASYASRSARYNITRNMFCAGFSEGGRDTCLGDSGGAFVMEDGASGRWAVFGLVSWGGPGDCGSQGLFGVYTRVAPYLDWILEQLGTAPW